MMTNKELFNTVISRLETESFLSGFGQKARFDVYMAESWITSLYRIGSLE